MNQSTPTIAPGVRRTKVTSSLPSSAKPPTADDSRIGEHDQRDEAKPERDRGRDNGAGALDVIVSGMIFEMRQRGPDRQRPGRGVDEPYRSSSHEAPPTRIVMAHYTLTRAVMC